MTGQRERWRTCRMPDGSLVSDYEVSNLGRVRRRTPARGTYPGKNVKPVAGRYLQVSLSVRNQPIKAHVHILVLSTFRGPRPNGAVSRHLDGDAHNNAAANLRWGTQKENLEDTLSHGRANRGRRNGNAKLDSRKVTRIKRRIRAGEPHDVIAQDYGVHPDTVSQIGRGYRWGWLNA